MAKKEYKYNLSAYEGEFNILLAEIFKPKYIEGHDYMVGHYGKYTLEYNSQGATLSWDED